jgi:uncharacterized protein (DUF169 family)
MKSLIAEELKLRKPPVAVIFANEKPEGAIQFREDHWACVVSTLNPVMRGKVFVFDRKRYGCIGGAVGLCFGNRYSDRETPIEDFLSSVEKDGRQFGEAYKKTPELARSSLAEMPVTDVDYKYVIFKRLKDVDPETEEIQVVTFLANPDQLSALVVLANFARPDSYNVMIPWVAGCQSMVLLPYNESKKKYPRAVVGMVDISARPHIDPDLFSFAVPLKMFRQMEADVPQSFLRREAWQKIKKRL